MSIYLHLYCVWLGMWPVNHQPSCFGAHITSCKTTCLASGVWWLTIDRSHTKSNTADMKVYIPLYTRCQACCFAWCHVFDQAWWYINSHSPSIHSFLSCHVSMRTCFSSKVLRYFSKICILKEKNMLPKLCTHCNKWFSCKSSLNRHTKTFHRPHVQPPVDDDHGQSGGMNGVGPSQTKYENANNQVYVASQTNFGYRPMIDNDGSDKL